ncbi:hypothetical protein ACHWQZ_G001048 [Mnemiopsis leidyi]
MKDALRRCELVICLLVVMVSNIDFGCEVYFIPITTNLVAFYEKTASFQVTVYPLPENCANIDRNNITWVKLSGSLPISRIEMSYDQDDTLATLKMRALEESDLGIYRCEVDYKGMIYSSENIVLDLRTKPEVIPVESTVTAVLGSTAELSVTVKADPPANPTQITWNTLKILWDDKRFRVSEDGTSLRLSNVSKSDGDGYFSCEVRTDYANDRAYIRLLVVELPEIEGGDETVSLFGSEVLTCEASGDPLPEFVWILPNETQVSGKELEITETGNYKCIATNSAGEDSKTITVLQGEVPTIDGLKEKYYLKKIGEELEVDCVASGAPSPEIVWRFGETGVSETRELRVTVDSFQDLGNYTCIATNSGGEETFTVELRLAETPLLTLSDDYRQIELGDSLDVTCSSKSDPTATVLWVFDGKTLISDRGTLKLNSLTEEDTGNYSCVADNGYFHTEKIFQLFVFEEPVIKVTVENSTVHKGEEIELICTGRGLPAPSLTWLKDDFKFSKQETDTIVSDRTITNKITTTSAELDHSGNYTCKGYNEYGVDTDSVNIVVLSEPFWVENFESETLNITTGTLISIACKMDGNPVPETKVYLTNVNQLGLNTSGGTLEAEEMETNADTYQLEEGPSKNFTWSANQSVETAVVLCRGVNEFGSLSASRILYVHDPFHLQENRTREMSVYIATTNYELSCPIEGHPPPSNISWRLPSGNVEMTFGEDPLLIEEFGFSDEGEYTCTVINKWGMMMTTSLLLAVDYDKPNVTVDYKDVAVGQVGIITCIGHGQPAVNLTLHRGEEKVQNVTVHTKSDPSLGEYVVLTYTYLMSRELVGRWSCTARNSLGDVDSKNIDLQLFRRAEVKLTPPVERNSRYNDTDPIDVFCNATGDPSPTVTILINGLNSTSGSNSPGILVFNLENGVYKVRLKNSQLGTTRIECSAENVWGKDRKTTSVLNTYSLSCYKCITQVCASANADISIAHIIAVYPEPSYIKWNVTTTSPEVLNKFQNTSIQIDPGFVEYEAFISSITADTTSVKFEIADPRGGEPLSVQTELEIYEPISAVLLAPTESLRAGDNVTITASVTAKPLPRLRWFLNQQEIAVSSEKAVVEESRLTLVDVSGGARHVVTLELVPQSSCHTARKQSVVVTILGDSPPRIYDMPPLIEKEKGEKIYLMCRAAGDPVPTVSWYKRSTLHSELRFSAVHEAMLRIESMSVDEAGTWECRASNNAGQTDSKLLELVLAPESSGALGSDSSPEVILSTILTVVFVVLVGPLLLAVYCLKRKRQRRLKVVTPVSDPGFLEGVSLEKEIRKLVTPDFYPDLPTEAEEKKSTENGRTSNPALYANPDTNNKLPPLPRRCNSAQTARSRELGENDNRVQSASPT